MFSLRPYQTVGVEDIRSAFRGGYQAPLYVLATGGGKTVIFSYIGHHAALKGKRVWVLAHRDELVAQASRSMDEMGIRHGIIRSGLKPKDFRQVQIASVLTLVRRLDTVAAPDLIIVDEADLAMAPCWMKIFAAFPNAKILGVTATPQRLDGRGLGKQAGGCFDVLIEGPSVSQLIAEGWLAKPVYFAPPKDQLPDVSQVKSSCGDFKIGQLAGVMNKPNITGNAIEHYRKHIYPDPALVFCVNVQHAKDVAEAFRLDGLRAESIDGKMASGARAEKIFQFGNGGLHILTNCEIATRGTDIPRVVGAIILRPTESLALHRQIMGRVLRLFPGKTRAVILDHVGNVWRHGFAETQIPWTLEGKKSSKHQKAEPEVQIRQCPECYAVFPPAPVCPTAGCGYVFPAPKEQPKVVAGNLQQVGAADIAKVAVVVPQTAEDCRTLPQLIAFGRARGYKNAGWWARKTLESRRSKSKRALPQPV
jgi:superfamily II DNA or RNA helicase